MVDHLNVYQKLSNLILQIICRKQEVGFILNHEFIFQFQSVYINIDVDSTFNKYKTDLKWSKKSNAWITFKFIEKKDPLQYQLCMMLIIMHTHYNSQYVPGHH